MKHKCISVDSPYEWNEELKGIKHSLAHTRDNCYAMKLTTGYNTYLYSYENDEIKIVCPVSEREYKGYTDIVTPYGFSGFAGNYDCQEFSDHWKEFVKEKKYVCGYISMNPLFENKTYFRKEDEYISTNLYFINLDLSLTELFENLDANRKKQLRDYRSIESKFVYDRKILSEFFIENYYDFLKRIKASAANYFSRETLEYFCSLENVFMVGTGRDKKIEAVYIFGHTQHAVDCLFNIAIPEGREYSPYLLWCGVKYFKKKKIPVMNLGGGIKKDDNVALSKERFGAYKLPFVNLKQVYDKEVYNKLCSEIGSDSDDLSGYFPGYRKLVVNIY